MIAALYVLPNGVYSGLPDVDPWPESRDARLYDGPYPCVAHPPCARWGRYWHGGPSAKVRRVKGDDGGCFAAALAAVRKWGGVLEHPQASAAWRAFDLNEPPWGGGWIAADFVGGWTCCVEQGHYGHRARKSTWLYACGVSSLPLLKWGNSDALCRMEALVHSAEERRAYRKLPKDAPAELRARRNAYLESVEAAGGKTWCAPERLSKTERLSTPLPFRDLLLTIARAARPAAARLPQRVRLRPSDPAP
jgi:hypothetical protein